MRGQVKLVLPLVLLLASACTSQPRVVTEVELNYEGLRSVNSQRFTHAQVRPGIDFTDYRAVQILDPELEFRTPDRSNQEFPLQDEQKDRFRDLLLASFRDEFASSESLAQVNHSGPDVLTLKVRIIDIVARVPPRTLSPGSRGSIALDARGRVTLVLEVSDSETDEILARGVESREVRGAAMQRDATMITRWEDVDLLTDRWALAAREGLEDLVSFDGS